MGRPVRGMLWSYKLWASLNNILGSWDYLPKEFFLADSVLNWLNYTLSQIVRSMWELTYTNDIFAISSFTHPRKTDHSSQIVRHHAPGVAREAALICSHKWSRFYLMVIMWTWHNHSADQNHAQDTLFLQNI